MVSTVTHDALQRGTPAHALPVELLSRIFLMGADLASPSPFLLKPDSTFYVEPSTQFQVTVSHVCHQWRRVSLQTASLWTSLNFRTVTHMERALTFISRAGSTSLLDIFVDTASLSDHIPGTTIFRSEFSVVVGMIIPLVKRWRSLCFKVRDHECRIIARKALGTCGPSPELETLQLYHFENFANPQSLYLVTSKPTVIVFDGGLPRLRNLSLIGVNLPWPYIPSWKNLRNLELALHSESVRPPYADWERILRDCPGLRKLSLHYSGPQSHEEPAAGTNSRPTRLPPARKMIYLPLLDSLSLTDLDSAYLLYVLDPFSLPALRHLSLDLPDQDVTAFVDRATGRSKGKKPLFPQLSHLSVTALECSLEGWRALLSVPQMEILDVNFAYVPDTFYDVLVESQGGVSELANGGARFAAPALHSMKVTGLSNLRLRRLIEVREDVRSWTVGVRPHDKDGIMEELAPIFRTRKLASVVFSTEDDDDDDIDEDSEGETEDDSELLVMSEQEEQGTDVVRKGGINKGKDSNEHVFV